MMSQRSPLRGRNRPRHVWRAGAASCLAMALVACEYTARDQARGQNLPQPSVANVPRLVDPPQPPFLMVRSMRRESFNKVVVVPLAAPDGPAYESSLQCDRVYYAAQRGVCLTVEPEGGVNAHYAYTFDGRYSKQHRIRLSGVPSRARISPDGRRAAITVFEKGHSYAEDGMSTRTSLVDMATGRIVADLEQFRITRDGKAFREVDFNFWGMTFKADGNGFYVTLASGGKKYLVEGDIDKRTGRVVRAGVECPSLSPDNSKIVYKDLILPGFWQLRVHDLRSGEDRPLKRESRSVDDQVDWLDNDRVVYHISDGTRGADVWTLNINGSEAAKTLRQYSYSPAVVRR